MKVGIIGCGKLGMPVALALESKGHEVVVYDVNPDVPDYLNKTKPYPHQEEYVEALLQDTKIKAVDSVETIVHGADIIFCAIQTPHERRFEGDTRLPDERADFDYSFLKTAVTDVAEAANKLKKVTTLAVISTCLPGTFKREIEPLLNEYIQYVYNPLYIAMGTVVMDFLFPEFVLIGQRDVAAKEKLEAFYQTITDKPNVVTDITTAEGIKVSYNTWITAKTVLANAWGEMSERLGMNFDDLFKAWSLATERLISPRYMRAGMSDGGGCHPRDNIALSHIAKKIGMSHNIWEDLMHAREDHIHWFASMIAAKALKQDLPVIILGRSFKPETNIETGSGAVLLANILGEFGIKPEHYENYVCSKKAVYFIGTQHGRYKELQFPAGSIVIDPFGYIPEQDGVTITRIGRK